MSDFGRVLTNVDPHLVHCWHPVARLDELGDQALRVMLLGEPWIVVRAGAEVVAYRDRCPHRGAPLSLGHCQGEQIECAYHGWCFALGDGQVSAIPALGADATLPSRAQLSAAYGTAVSGGIVYLAPKEPLVDLPSVAEDNDATFARADLPVLTVRASAGLMADNFLDMAHFPFIHRGTFGAAEARTVDPYHVERGDWGFTCVYEHEFANREDPGVTEGLRPLIQRRRMTYRYLAPFHLVLRLDYLDTGGSNVISFAIQPEGAESVRLYSSIWRNDLDGDPERMAAAVDFELAVLEEDRQLQSSYDDLFLPLDLGDEIHTRADRITVELRRVLAELLDAIDSSKAEA